MLQKNPEHIHKWKGLVLDGLRTHAAPKEISVQSRVFALLKLFVVAVLPNMHTCGIPISNEEYEFVVSQIEFMKPDGEFNFEERRKNAALKKSLNDLYLEAVQCISKFNADIKEPGLLLENVYKAFQSSNERYSAGNLYNIFKNVCRQITVKCDIIEEIIDYGVQIARSTDMVAKYLYVFYKSYIDFCFSDYVLNNYFEHIQTVFDLFLELSNVKRTVMPWVAINIINHLNKLDRIDVKWVPVLTQLAIFGPLKEASDEMISRVCNSELQRMEGDDDFKNQDVYVRIITNDFFNRLRDGEFAANMILQLLEFDKRQFISAKTAFPNTILHRRKIRLWMSIIVLFQVADMTRAKEYAKKIIQSNISEFLPSNQAYVIWGLCIVILKDTSLIGLIFEQLRDMNLRTAAVNGFVAVLKHVCMISGDEEIAKEGYKVILPWLVSNNYTTRAFCAYTLDCTSRFMKMSEEQQSLVRLFKENKQMIKVIEKAARETEILSKFHPIESISLDVIFHKLLLNHEVDRLEMISYEGFLRVNQRAGNVPFTSGFNSECTDEEQVPITATEDYVNYQRKITPWQEMLKSDLDLTQDLAQDCGRIIRQDKGFDFILVASLVERTTNLGGLCRTCEIFGITELIVPNMRITNDEMFKTLCVTADKWMRLNAVEPQDLSKYLTNMKAKGYKLIGIEQTTKSISLLDYKFPKKCVLVLGREKDGIPIDLIDLLDDCVEIPQFGVIRSLNVHVSGSIVLWEARKQAMNQASE
jgi:tRNA G18 (ribose-2'-O)-methylase SpoU